MITATAFSPGHITGFFAPVFSVGNIKQSGSIGAGISISPGATSTVAVESSTNTNISVQINNKTSPAPVTTLAIHHLIDQKNLSISVKTKLDLPMGQGFGMSAAGALSSVLATAKALQLSSSDALVAAHTAEVELRTGLGDVLASSFGGIEIRRTPGLPPWGMIEHIPGKYELVLCVVGKKINTTQVLSDKKRLAAISSIGRLCTKQLLEHPSVEHLFQLSNHFSVKTGLASTKLQQIIQQSSPYGSTSMCMLGNSLFSMGKTSQLCQILAPFGKVFLCTVDTLGARILK